VSYNLSGSAQPGVDYKVLSGVVVIPAGARSVTVTISTLKNGVIFQPSDMLVANWPSRIGSIEVKSGEFVLQGTTLFNLTEPEFTVVMNVSPTDRAKLAVNQAAKVNFNSGETILEGVVGQLDDTPTVDETGNSFYEGKVSVNSNLESVDGAKVSIDIILQLKENVLAVPVAAVLRAADGDEVRVVTDDGKLTRVKVEIGLIDGEWAEIISGLKGDELVVIDVDPSADISASD
jgi:multidrug efflux pump subunit AcrA (membrane-fusion protein)